jgi:flavin reductase (DIM6/NTAB) family NADH-FMN oxidoreductase RutF
MEAPAPASNQKIIDGKTFWRAIGQRAIGSTIVTACSSDGPAGFLGLSATHVCADPPLMLVSIDKRTSALATILSAGHFAINFMPKDATPAVDAFTGKTSQTGAARFQEGQWQTLKTGAPVFIRAIGAIDCKLEETIERHGVCLAIGRVVDTYQGAEDGPLIHFRGSYLS